MQVDFEKFYCDVTDFIHTSKMTKEKNVKNILGKLDELEEDQLVDMQRRIDNEFHFICHPDPTSLPPYIIVVLQHGSEALKRVGVLACVMIIANYIFSPQKLSPIFTLAQGIAAGITTFGASVIYDNNQTTTQKKLERLMLFKSRLNEFNLESKSHSPRIKFT
ncbi:MAG: hypothetical protein H0U71_04950 [Gammaproteobacteria bacterium]|nr:hypothetical protein [Gammaproteobacteria bacterium]